MTEDNREPPVERLRSGVRGLDLILHGGFLRDGIYIVQGPPGAGKTILASQIVYAHAAAGHRCVHVTVLAENLSRMMLHLRPMRFFDPSRIPERVAYVSGFGTLDEGGTGALLALLRREIEARKASLLILDGLVAVEASTCSDIEMKKFTHELQAVASALGCTIFLLTSRSGTSVLPEETMVDGIIELNKRLYGVRNRRHLQVQKLRGSDFLEGEHGLRITEDGVVVFPRIEALLAAPSVRDEPQRAKATTGIGRLDDMFHGGVPVATATALMGPTGAGKTTLGLQFLAPSSAAEPGLLFGFFETPPRLRQKAAAIGFDLASAEEKGTVEIIWQALGEHILDELAHRLLDAVRRRNVRRLVVDGFNGFQEASTEPRRMTRFFSTLSNELRALGVTSIYTLEAQEMIGPVIRVPVTGISSLVENVILMRFVELGSKIHRLLSVLKVRDSDFDPMLRNFTITSHGIVPGDPFEGFEAILSGSARRPQREVSSEGRRRPGSGRGQKA